MELKNVFEGHKNLDMGLIPSTEKHGRHCVPTT